MCSWDAPVRIWKILNRELEKLLCYTLGKGTITTDDVAAVCTEQTENRIFDMIQAITEQNQRQALDLYADLLSMKEPPMRILYLITRQFSPAFAVKGTVRSWDGTGRDGESSRYSTLCYGEIYGTVQKVYKSAASKSSRGLRGYGRKG